MPIDTSWLRVHFAQRGLHWALTYGFSWNALSLYVITPWFGVGVDYEAPHAMYHPPAVTTGYCFGWGRNDPKEGALRYRHWEEHRWAHDSEEWARLCR